LREGLEDYEYLRMCAQKDPARARRNALSVFPMNASNSGSTYHASNYPDPAAPTAYTTNLETARDDLAACIGAPSLVRNPAASIVKSGDYNADGRSDFAIWRPTDGTWWIMDNATGASFTQQWGLPGDMPVPGDYDGDGRTDLAVWRPADGNWIVLSSSTGAQTIQQWGVEGDIPVPGDYDGDGRTDVAIWRPTDGNWWIIGSGTGMRIQQWGIPDDIPVTNTRAAAF